MKTEIYDARNGDHITSPGATLRHLLKNRIQQLIQARADIVKRMSNEIVDKDEAVALLLAIHDNKDLNERALFIKACVERAAHLEKEIKELNTLGQTFSEAREYRITLADAVRFGL